jgi:type I restriction enzyme R subunit
MEDVFGANGTLDRETPGKVVLLPRMRSALEKLNPALPSEVVASMLEAQELGQGRVGR